MGNIKKIIITKQKNPRLYKSLLRKGGTLKFKNYIMTIHSSSKPKKSILQTLINKLNKIRKNYI